MPNSNLPRRPDRSPAPRRWLIWLTTACLPFVLGSCANVDIKQYQHEQPALVMQEFFSGTLDGWGIFQDRSGKVIKRFHVVINASWQNDTGTLKETFTWSDNDPDNPSQRVWTLVDQGQGKLTGSAGDVIGLAQSDVSGNSLHWRYVLALPLDGKIIHVDFDDWMYLVDKDTMLNRSVMKKYGFRLGEVFLTLRRRQP